GVIQSLRDLGRDVLRGPSGTQHSEGREALIRRAPNLHHRDPLRPRVHRQQGPGVIEPHPFGGIGGPNVKKHDRVPGQARRRCRVHHSATAEAENPPVGCKGGRDLSVLELAEPRLPLIKEDVRDRPPLLCFNRVVGVVEPNSQQHGQNPPHRRLARSWGADEDGGRARRGIHCVTVHGATHHERRLAGIASREPRWFLAVSATLSPPNFSRHAWARTRATMASATTPAAGTAHTSERWWMAVAACPVATSTVASALGTVLIGFMAARTRRTSPVDMPPSVPPARPVRRLITPSCPRSISSCATDPRRVAVTKPSPVPTPSIALVPIH